MNAARINAIIAEAHATAKEKGWWQDGNERDVEEVFALIHSEAAEATEAAREGKLALYYREDGKPEGVIAEMADVVIRTADYLGKRGHVCTVSDEDAKAIVNIADTERAEVPKTPVAMCNRMHVGIAKASEAPTNPTAMAVRMGLTLVRNEATEGIIWGCYIMAKLLGLDLEEAIDKKMAFNKTRPHRHGGKLA